MSQEIPVTMTGYIKKQQEALLEAKNLILKQAAEICGLMCEYSISKPTNDYSCPDCPIPKLKYGFLICKLAKVQE